MTDERKHENSLSFSLNASLNVVGSPLISFQYLFLWFMATVAAHGDENHDRVFYALF